MLVPSLIKNWSVDTKSVLDGVGKIAVAVTPVNPAPLPKKEPLNEPDRFELAPVNWSEVVPVIAVPLSVRDELANAAPVHLVMLLVLKVDAPLTATVAVVAPS